MPHTDCIKCSTPFKLAAWQVKNYNYICTPCRRKEQRAKPFSKKRIAKEKQARKIPSEAIKFSARDKLRYAVKTGRIKKHPCAKCGDVNSEAHHADYSKPYDVTWLCRLHHMQAHKEVPQ